MRLPDDDELYQVDGSYLGPPGRYIGVMRYKAIFLWMIVGPLLWWLLVTIGVPLNLLTVGLTLIFSVYLANELADRISPERSVMDLLRTFGQEVSAPRYPGKTEHARGIDLRTLQGPGRLPLRKHQPRHRAGRRGAKREVVENVLDDTVLEEPAR